jgi:hypothetical protein
MLINISKIFLEENINFKISYKVDKLIMEKLSELNLEPINKSITKKRDYIGFLISTTKNANEIIINDPQFRKRSKFIDISITLPFLEYNKEDYLNKYLNNLEKAIIIGLSKLEIKDERIENIFNKIEEEIINNENYKYIEPFKQKID